MTFNGKKLQKFENVKKNEISSPKLEININNINYKNHLKKIENKNEIDLTKLNELNKIKNEIETKFKDKKIKIKKFRSFKQNENFKNISIDKNVPFTNDIKILLETYSLEDSKTLINNYNLK